MPFIPLAAIPVALAATSLAVGAASAVVSYEGQQSAAKSQTDYEQNLAQQKNLQFTQQSDQLREQQGQEALARAQQVQNIHQQSAAAIATAATSAGEGGVSGLSVQNLLADFQGQEANYASRTNEQGKLVDAQAQSQQEALQSGTTYDKTSILSPVSAPSFAGAALRIVGSGLDAYSTYNSTKQAQAAAKIYGSTPVR